MTQSLLIIGAGHAAGQLVASLAQRKAEFAVSLVGNEAFLPYQRPPLSKKFLAGEVGTERLLFRPPGFYDDPLFDVHTGTQITGLDRSRKIASTASGVEFHYDRLVLALGSRARTLEIPGSELQGIHTLRTISDANRLRPHLAPGKRLTIIGAGYIGMEVAAIAVGMGVSVSVIESGDRIMARSVSRLVSDVYTQAHRSHGVSVILDATVSAFSGSDRVGAVELADGRSIESDAVIVGIGALPNTELAEAAGLETRGGVVVNAQCRTSDADIFAIGDCTVHPNPLLGRELQLESVHNALEQAKTTAAVLCGEEAEYAEIPWFWSDQFDMKLQIAGLSGDHDQMLVRGSVESRRFSCLYLRDKRLLAIDAVNSPMDFIQAKLLIAERRELDLAKLQKPETPLKSCAV